MRAAVDALLEAPLAATVLPVAGSPDAFVVALTEPADPGWMVCEL